MSKETSRNETPVKERRGLKRPRPELDGIIRVVNLLPDPPPELPLTVEQVNDFPLELKESLDAAYDAAFDYSGSTTHAWEVMEWQYKEIVETREALRQLMCEAHEISDEQTFYFHESIDARAYILVGDDRRVKVQMSSFARAIQGAEIDYLRSCQTCDNIFYAGRKNQNCCSVKCAKAQRQKRWRQRFKDGEPAYHK